MSNEEFHPEYPTEAQIEELWAAYKSSGREGIVAILRKRARELQKAEGRAEQRPPETTEL